MTDQQDGLFDAPAPAAETAAEHLDAAVARRIITDYYTGRAETAKKALDAALAAYSDAKAELDDWTERGTITSEMLPDGAGGQLDMTVYAIVDAADRAHRAAMWAVIPEMGGTYTTAGREAADRAGADAQALRRWLVDQGHALPGEDGRPTSATSSRKRRGGKRDGAL